MTATPRTARARTIRCRHLVTVVLSLTSLLAVPGLLAGSALAQDDSAEDLVLGVLSPVTSPACQAAGLTSFLIPTITAPLDDAMGSGAPVDVNMLLQELRGPILVVCGTLHYDGPRTTCEIGDGPIAAVWPSELNAVGLDAPNPVGALAAGLDTTGSTLGVEIGAQEVLACRSPAPAPPGAPPHTPVPTLPDLPPSSTTPTSTLTSPTASPGPPPSTNGPVPDLPTVGGPDLAEGDTETAAAALPLPPNSPGSVGIVVAAAAILGAGALWTGSRQRHPR